MSNSPLHTTIEQCIINHGKDIEQWFQQQFQQHPAPITSSVDLRNAHFKLAPVDTNLFPAGFNNLNTNSSSVYIHAIQEALYQFIPTCQRILIIPETHTRNLYYMQSLWVLYDIIVKAGFKVAIGSFDPQLTQAKTVDVAAGKSLTIHPLLYIDHRIQLSHFDPCIILLNNDLSAGIPDILSQTQQLIVSPPTLGWSTRLKSTHFKFYQYVAQQFADQFKLDPWLITPYFNTGETVDFMTGTGIDALYYIVENLLKKIQQKYNDYNIMHPPFVVIKADNGTYGMNVMTIRNANELTQLNRKQRSRMRNSKGGRQVTRVVIQEGVYTFETMPDGSIAEPVIYMLGSHVIGGFYRIHKERGHDENLNAPGMYFDPLQDQIYIYGVIARLAALAAAHEIQQQGAAI